MFKLSYTHALVALMLSATFGCSGANFDVAPALDDSGNDAVSEGGETALDPDAAETGDADPVNDTLEAGGHETSTDTGVDSGILDTGSNPDTSDTGIDSGSMDTGAADSGTLDTGTVDSGAIDTGTVDSGPPMVCTPGAGICSGTASAPVPSTCNSSGSDWTAGSTCNSTNPTCLKGSCVACTPGATRCTGYIQGGIQTCDSTGAWVTTITSCQYVCTTSGVSGGDVVTPTLVGKKAPGVACEGVCVPNTWSCTTTMFAGATYNARHFCGSTGDGYGTPQICSGSTPNCDGGTCVP